MFGYGLSLMATYLIEPKGEVALAAHGLERRDAADTRADSHKQEGRAPCGVRPS